MSWIILEGLDRTGKSTVANFYKKKGYEVVHMSAPNKKYVEPGYTGPSYLDELLDLYMKHNNKDVVFDRSGYGEMIWPVVYGRKPQLTEEDLEILRDYENINQTERILMHDSNADAHWKRCVENKEPLTKQQFINANILFRKMAEKFEFTKLELTQFQAQYLGGEQPSSPQQEVEVVSETVTQTENSTTKVTIVAPKNNKPTELQKLELANSINEILSKRILKQKGNIYDNLENEIRGFLSDKLSEIFGSSTNISLTKEEIQILKLYAQRIKNKMEAK
jgi:hypothetical protein